MDKLKQFINDNREAFDTDQLLPDHKIRFERMLPRTRNNAKLYSLYALAVAASVAILIVFTLPFMTLERPANEGVICQTAKDIENLSTYYNMQMNEIVEQIKAFNPGNMTLEKQQIVQEAARVMAISKQFENTVMPQLPCSDETLFAMNQYYGTSIQSLNFMLFQMKNIKEKRNQ